METQNYTTIKITQQNPNSPVFTLSLNRPHHSNALSLQFFTEFPNAISSLDQNPNVALILLSGTGNHFCSGIDLTSISSLTADVQSSSDRGRSGEKLLRQIKHMQDAITADLGSLQRLPGIVGFGNAMELALTARRFSGLEAKELGLVSKVFGCREEMEEGVRVIAEGIAAKSPLAVIGTKRVMLKSRDLTLDQGLDHVATWNSATLLSSDLEAVMKAHLRKTKPSFSKL
ncbi:putative enoyl-CoA hydratase/isomerase, ClpP/crotonase-like domain superfamily [Helianthus annuus]|nr:putative enoyl-CoA hydratase/isomerase, ClpP/crotonase-like domain superfamily [Helianthus annuus]